MGTNTAGHCARSHDCVFSHHVRHYDLREYQILHYERDGQGWAESLAARWDEIVAFDYVARCVGDYARAVSVYVGHILLSLEERAGELEDHGGKIRGAYYVLDCCVGDLSIREESAWER